jgi:hypothetical protein
MQSKYVFGGHKDSFLVPMSFPSTTNKKECAHGLSHVTAPAMVTYRHTEGNPYERRG